jgi:putative transcriptional regulator
METKIQTGKVLLADPFMMDPNFKRSVILLCDHSREEGSVGFILNKPLEMPLNDLVANFPEFEAQVYYGGPVQTNTIHYIHNVGDILDDSVEIGRGVFWGGDFEKLKFLITSQLIQPGNIRFFVGYSGWSPGQLAEELDYHSWIPAEMDANYLYKSKPHNLWNQIMYNKGNLYSVIAQMPDDVCLN